MSRKHKRTYEVRFRRPDNSIGANLDGESLAALDRALTDAERVEREMEAMWEARRRQTARFDRPIGSDMRHMRD